MNYFFLTNSFLPTLIASILGSTHCIAMCGGFSCLACTRNNNNISRYNRALSYNLGRLISYLTIVNLILFSDLSLKNLSLVSSLSGYLLLTIIILQLLFLIGLGSYFERIGLMNKINQLNSKLFGQIVNRAVNNSTVFNTLLLGSLTAMIPCGWLYLNLSLASTQSNFLEANLLVLAFWLGTIPALSLIGLGSNSLANKLKGRSRILAFLIVTILSLYSLSKHFPEFSSRIGLDTALCHIIHTEATK